ncbi:hypothetical protein [Aerosakkonema funiforme]|uniref:hypothetical protein n=1 Tax=Aerosakkonema funiforme TaxID=1246630 RepID=UPI0035BB93AA
MQILGGKFQQRTSCGIDRGSATIDVGKFGEDLVVSLQPDTIAIEAWSDRLHLSKSLTRTTQCPRRTRSHGKSSRYFKSQNSIIILKYNLSVAVKFVESLVGAGLSTSKRGDLAYPISKLK